MAKVGEAHVEAARLMLAQEGVGNGSAAHRGEAALRVYHALARSLAPVIGGAGVRALFARSVRLHRADYPCLEEVLGASGDSHEAPFERRVVTCLWRLEPAKATELATLLYGTFFALMTTFIGERVVQQIVKQAYPSIDMTDERGSKERS